MPEEARSGERVDLAAAQAAETAAQEAVKEAERLANERGKKCSWHISRNWHSGYSFRKLFSELMYDITTHSALPLVIVRNIGIFTFLVSIILGIVYLIRYLTGGITVPGWTSIILVLLASTGLTLLSIGILGEYMLHVLNESKKMPNYVLRQKDID